MIRHHHGQHGFTLIELMMAFTVLTIAVMGATSIAKSTANHLRSSDQIQQATELGFNHLAELGSQINLAPGQFNGQYPNGFLWELDIKLQEKKLSGQPLKPTGRGIAAFSLDLRIRYPDGERQFHDLQLRPVPAEGETP